MNYAPSHLLPIMSQPNALTSDRFVEMTAKSGLVDEAKFNRWVDGVREKLDGRLPKNPDKIARALVRGRLITQWHADKLLAGKYRGFFLGKYKLLGHIGTGGMSSVYLAKHIRMGDRRAIKVLPKNRVSDATYLARFQLEAKAIASLNHPNIVRAYDIDNEGDIHFIVMEYVDGVDLQRMVKADGPVDPTEAAAILTQAARGLHHAHGRGIIHRDIKPANVLVDKDGTVKLLDMGLALMEADDQESLTVMNNESVLGTADYLAPEQALNSHNVDCRTDIYGLGCTMYYLLTGRPPFVGGSLAQRIVRHQNEDPDPINQHRGDLPAVGGELEGVIIKMMQKKPAYRYQSAAEVAHALASFAQASTSTVAEKTRSMAAAALAVDTEFATALAASGSSAAGGLSGLTGIDSLLRGGSSLSGVHPAGDGSSSAIARSDTAVARDDETLGDQGPGGGESKPSPASTNRTSASKDRGRAASDPTSGENRSHAAGTPQLSGGDSGRLMPRARGGPAIDDLGSSSLDLQRESGYAPQRGEAKARSDSRSHAAGGAAMGDVLRKATTGNTKTPAVDGHHPRPPQTSPAGSQPPNSSPPPSSSSRPESSSKSNSRGFDTPLLIALAVILFVAASGFGFAIARLTD